MSQSWERICDACRSSPCTLYCRTDLAYLCNGCDVRIHAASGHERVWICEACERSPTAFVCKVDAASLCTSCDADIHSANPLASRHHRVPIALIPCCVYAPQAAKPPILGQLDDDDDESEAASWFLINPSKNNPNQLTYGLLAVDEYLDFVDINSCQDNHFTTQQQSDVYNDEHKYCVDSVVPVQNGEVKMHRFQPQPLPKQNHNFKLDMEYETSYAGYCYPPSHSHSVSVSSIDGAVVPESTMIDAYPRPSKGTIDLFSIPPIQMTTQLTPMDRKARVLRYREKKKSRKFEKTIRYASRKAYAKTRPRIKGRFANRRDAEVEVDQMFSSTGYGIVPSF